MKAKEPYRILICRRCDGVPMLERDDMNEFSRVVCPGCGSHTAWAPTRWQAYEDWEDMQC